MKNIAFTRVASCVVFVSMGPVSDADWSAYVAFLAKTLPTMMPPRVLVVTEGAPPTPKQRRQIEDIGRPFSGFGRVAMVTASAVARTILTALAWFTPNTYKVFAPNELEAALDYLDPPLGDRARVKAVLPDLVKQASSK